jgi:predicted Zn finger-like uncharacterized protein
MAMTVSCPSCKTTLRIGEENQGKKMRCPSCQQVFKAPMLPADDPPPQEPDPAPEPAPRPRNLELDDRPSRRREPPAPPPAREEREEGRRRFRDLEEDERRFRDREDEEDRPRRSRRDEDEEDDRPRRRRRDDDEDDDRPRRRSPPPSSGGTAKTLAIISCCLFCMPLIGFILGIVAYNQANSALNSYPPGSEYRAERRSLESTKTIATVGMALAAVAFILAIALRVVANIR